MESTASSPRGAKRSRTRRSSDEEGGTLCEVKLEETVIVPNLLIQTHKKHKFLKLWDIPGARWL